MFLTVSLLFGKLKYTALALFLCGPFYFVFRNKIHQYVTCCFNKSYRLPATTIVYRYNNFRKKATSEIKRQKQKQ